MFAFELIQLNILKQSRHAVVTGLSSRFNYFTFEFSVGFYSVVIHHAQDDGKTLASSL